MCDFDEIVPGSIRDRQNLMKSIEEIAHRVLFQIANRQAPLINVRTARRGELQRTEVFEIVSWSKERSRKRFAIILKLLDEIHALLETNSIATKRDLFYRDITLYENQEAVVRNMDAIARILFVPRWRLNVIATSKGLIAGDLTYLDSPNGAFVDCRFANRNGIAIPSRVPDICELRSQASFVLLVEKDAVFQHLIDDNFMAKFNNRCILVTGKGYADHATRQMLRRLRYELNLPILALMDADPHGLDIFIKYKFGSPATLYCESLVIPDVELVGVLPSELASFPISRDQLIAMTENERTILNNLSQRVGNEPSLLRHIEDLTRLGLKMEIQALYNLGENYFTDCYLTNKIVQHLYRLGLIRR